MARRKIDGARTLVTGASSGIGREIALALARRGARLVLTARREDRLLALADEIEGLGHRAYLVAGDITDDALRQGVLDVVRTEFGALDLLVNNAGVGAIGPFAEADDQRLRQVMEVNFFAPAALLRSSISLLQAGVRPMIVNVSSVLGHRAVPYKSEYCASKFALHGLSDAIRAEFTRLGIDVLLVSPSTTRTEFFDSVLESNAELPWLALGGMRAAAVANKAVRAIRRGRHEIILTPGGKLLVWFDRLCPPIVNRLVARFGM
jgi:short-subunit dehydrogenase